MNPLAHTRHALDDPDRKRDYNRALFREVAPRYDLITRLLSFGRDAAWKRWMLQHIPADNPTRILDLACGTGDLTRALADAHPDADVIGLDLTPEMLERARRLAPDRITFLEADMTDTRLESHTIDLVTGGYALRNAPDLEAALREINRLLRPGGHAAFLDFSAPRSPLPRRLQYGLLLFWGGLWGLLLHADPRVYAYIARSLARFPDRPRLHHAFRQLGWTPVRHRRFMLGFIEVIICRKPVHEG